MKKVLWLASWYPSRVHPLNGDFIQRQAKSAALYRAITVIHVVKDPSLKGSGSTVIRTQTGNLTEIIAYYRPFRTGIALLDRFISWQTYQRLNRRLLHDYISAEGLPSLLHLHVALWAGITAVYLNKKWGVRYVLSEHWTGYQPRANDNVDGKSFVFRHWLRMVFKHASLLVPVSENLGRVITDRFFRLPISVIPNTVDTTIFTPMEQVPGIFQFIHVSAMDDRKRPDAILRCFAALQKEIPAIRLLMVGPNSEPYKTYWENSGWEGEVEFTGERSYAAVAGLMRASQALLLFSTIENLPCVILEALCCGVPVISSDTGGIKEVLHAGNGILVDRNDETALLAAMRSMVRQEHRFNKMAIASEAAEKYSYPVVGAGINDLYERMMTANS